MAVTDEDRRMIDYFIRPLGNLRSVVSRKDVDDFRSQPGMGFRSKPAGAEYTPVFTFLECGRIGHSG